MKDLVAKDLSQDPRVAQAKKLLLEALNDSKKKITKVLPPDKGRRSHFEDLSSRCSQARGGNIYYPYIGSGIGNGALVELEDGSVKYDFITGIGVHYFGHSHDAILESSIDAALQDTVMQGHLQQNGDQVQLMESFLGLAQKNGSSLEHCFLTSTGATANENAMKIIFQKHSPANRMLAFKKCFAGRTLALAQMTDKALYRDGLPNALSVDYLPFYRAEDHEGSIRRAVKVLKSHIARFPGLHAGMCLELVQGEGGYFPGNKEFFEAIFTVLKENDIAIWIDEVQSFGRTDEPFAFQHFGLDEHVDVVTVGKMSQVCATLYKAKYKPRPGLISQTFTSSTAAIRASQVILDELKSGGLCGKNGKITKLHDCFEKNLREMNKEHPGQFEGPYGLGAMVGMTVFDGDLDKTKAFARTLFDNGVISFIAGKEPTRIRFLMPVLAIEEKDINEVCKIISRTMHETKG
ncbi:MAG: aminotransferase class III-fold pyridoxal phosphate-dependent enzyme [Lentisphaeraceae bacterium]|nr:aminotransferase class III-fold pyridoxal phosphate-dependent enzyme [Lentisphaeraceae bacterium]